MKFKKIPREGLDMRQRSAKDPSVAVLVDAFVEASHRGHASKFPTPDNVVKVGELWADRHVLRAMLLDPPPAPGTEYVIAFAPVPTSEDPHGRWYVLPELTVGEGLKVRVLLITLDAAEAKALRRGGTAAVIKQVAARREAHGLAEGDEGDRPLVSENRPDWGQLMWLRDDPSRHKEIVEAEIVYGIDLRAGRRVLVFGRDVLEEIIAGGQTRRCRVVSVPIDYESDELEMLVAAVRALRGRHDYQPREDAS